MIAYEQALASGDKPNILRALELIGKTCGAFSENLNISTDQRRDYTALERIEMKRISSHLLTSQADVIDVETD